MSDARHLSEEQRAEYVDGRMAAEVRAAVERHLGTCMGCRASVEQDRAVVALLRGLPALEPPRSFILPAPVVRPAWARAAAWTRLASGLAATFLVVLLGVELLAPPLATVPAYAPAPELRSRALLAKPAQEAVAPAATAAPAAAASTAAPAGAAAAGPTVAPARAAPAAAAAAKPAAKLAEQPAAALQAGTSAPEQSVAAPPAAPVPAEADALKASPAEPPVASQVEAPAAPLADTATAFREEGRLQAMGTPAPLPAEQAQPGSTWGFRQWEALLAALMLLLGGAAFVFGRRAGAGR